MIPFLKSLYLSKRFFAGIAVLAALCIVGYWVPMLFLLAQVGLAAFAAGVLADGVLLWGRGGIEGGRDVPAQLSNGDANGIALSVRSRYRFPVRVRVLDEVPVQFQERGEGFSVSLAPGEVKRLRYALRPTERGAYRFGRLNLYAASPIGLLLRRFRTASETEAAVYPSVLQMHRYAFLAASNRLEEVGVKKVRRVGQTMEFDQIRAYVPGDDRRTVNWKATARRSGGGGLNLMVNQYEEERAQPVYAVLDMGRTMRSPFDGLTLLDHAINAALVLLNIALQKGDKAGLVAFNEEVRTVLAASRRRGQLGRLLDALYRLDTTFLDPSFEALLATMEHSLRHRGLVLLFTNFETRSGLQRQLPYLRRIARRHRLVVVFFENAGLRALLDRPAQREEDVYVKAFAEGLEVEKREIARELERHGIGALLTKPEALTVDAINRYVALKARGPF